MIRRRTAGIAVVVIVAGLLAASACGNGEDEALELERHMMAEAAIEQNSCLAIGDAAFVDPSSLPVTEEGWYAAIGVERVKHDVTPIPATLRGSSKVPEEMVDTGPLAVVRLIVYNTGDEALSLPLDDLILVRQRDLTEVSEVGYPPGEASIDPFHPYDTYLASWATSSSFAEPGAAPDWATVAHPERFMIPGDTIVQFLLFYRIDLDTWKTVTGLRLAIETTDKYAGRLFGERSYVAGWNWRIREWPGTWDRVGD